MKKVKSQKLKIKSKAKAQKNHTDPLINNIIIFLAVLVIADLATILYFENQIQKTKSAEPAAKVVVNPAPGEFANPGAGKLQSLKTGGEFEKKMPPFSDALKFRLYYDKTLAGPEGLYVLEVCCPAGYSKEYYTSPVPWAFFLYDFEPGLPTVTLFEINKAEKTARFEIVILDKKADMQSIRSVSVTIFIELLKQYLPGYRWRGSVRKEMM